MDKSKVFEIFKFRKVIKKKRFSAYKQCGHLIVIALYLGKQGIAFSAIMNHLTLIKFFYL